MRPLFAVAKLVIKEIFRKKDFYVALILAAVILFYSAQLQFYNTRHIVRYLMEIGLLLVFALSAVLTAGLAARQYPSEVQNRTGEVLWAKPLSRFEFIAGKTLGSFAAGGACFFIFYVLFLSVAWIKGDGGLSPVLAAQTFFLFLLSLMVLAAMASAVSYYLTASASVTVTLILYFLVSVYGPDLKGVLYYGLPHFEFFDLRQRFIHDWEPLSTNLLLFLAAYAAGYVALFLLLAWLKMRKRPL